MLRSIKHFILIFVLLYDSSFAQAVKSSSGCLLALALRDSPDLNANGQFWEELGALSQTHSGNLPDNLLRELIEKHKPKDCDGVASGGACSSRFANPPEFEFAFHKDAEKEYDRLPPHLQEKVNEFLEIVLAPDGILRIRQNPGKWRLEKMAFYGELAYSVRLNGGYRILFDLHKNGFFFIRRINKNNIHSSVH